MFDPRGEWAAELRARLSSVRLSPAREAEIVEELSQHLDDRRRELIAQGVTPEAAARLILDEFDGDRLARYLAPLRQSRLAEVAPASRWSLLGGFMSDLRHALREFRAAPGFTVVALVVLTLGIGATTAIFSVVDAVVLRGLPFDEHDRLMAVGERRPPGLGGADGIINARVVTPDYHKALRIPLRRGRFFEPTDRMGVAPVVIINESAARKYFPGEDPIGRSVTIGRESQTIVGVVGDVHQTSLETDPRTEAYVPLAQVQNLRGVSDLVIRTSGDPYDVLPALKSAVMNVLPDVPLRNISTMDELFARRIAQRRLNMLLLGLFGLLGLVISAVGLYGVMAYVVSQRTREIGVRMALGATRAKVVGMVLINACVLVAAGLIIGGVGAWYLSATARAFLFGLEPNDPRAFIAAPVSLLLAGAIASIIPARRAASIDPVVALRAE